MVRVSPSAVAVGKALQANNTANAAMLEQEPARAGRNADASLCATSTATMPTRVECVTAPSAIRIAETQHHDPPQQAATSMANAHLIRDGLTRRLAHPS